MEAYRASHQKRNAVALSGVVVSHLFLLWLWGHPSSSVRLSGAPFVIRHKSITYLPMQPQNKLEVHLLPLTSPKPVESPKVLDGVGPIVQKMRRPAEVVTFNSNSGKSVGSVGEVQRESDLVRGAESVAEHTGPASTPVADTSQPAQAAASSTTLLRFPVFSGAMVRGRQARQPSLVEAVNQQLHPDGPKDKLKQDIEAAILPVCLASNEAGGILAPIAIAYAALRGRCKLP